MKQKILTLLTHKYIIGSLLVIAGLLIGRFLFSPSPSSVQADQSTQAASPQKEKQIWTCSMHPQIKMDKPGKCPICAMDLIPLRKNSHSSSTEMIDPNAVQLSKEAMALANIETSKVTKSIPSKTIRLYGKIAIDERTLQSQTSYVSGRIETLNVEFTGEPVSKGQTLAVIYSPDLYSAQQELIEAKRMNQPTLVEAAREKLRLWNMTTQQIQSIEQSSVPSPTIEIKANTSGIVVSKRVNRGDYVSQGSVLYEIANLDRVWAVFDAFEADLPFLRKGDKLTFTLSAMPGREYSGIIRFIDPMIDPQSRTARVRIDLPNAKQELKPEMNAMATVEASPRQASSQLIIPQTALLWTGKRSIVYVRQPDTSTPTFQLREIQLGASLNGAYVVESGLSEGEEIVTNGIYAIDASAQLEGKRSMMNTPDDGKERSHEGHQHQSPSTETVHKTHAMLKVNGNCEMCKQRIEEAAKSLSGVFSAQWDSKTQMLHLNFDDKKVQLNTIAQTLAKAGHDNEKYKASDAIYNQLPECCKYRE